MQKRKTETLLTTELHGAVVALTALQAQGTENMPSFSDALRISMTMRHLTLANNNMACYH